MSQPRLPAAFMCLAFFLALSPDALAQHDGSIRGRLQDTASHASVADATVTVLTIRDSSLVGFTRSDPSGLFRVNALDKGTYRLLITHVGYRSVSQVFVITDLIRSIDLGVIPLRDKAGLLDAFTVEQEAPPVTIRHDTVEFNASSFKTKPDAVVEDLLKKLPGVQVDKNGVIKANGEEVKKVLVDGKEFFGADPKIASKNLPADAVDKVQVFDKKSDQSQFTGFDDGNSQKTINLTIKKDKRRGTFGRATAAAGADAWPSGGKPAGDGRYEANLDINQFHNDRQLSAIGMANNTNKQGFSFQDVLGFGGGLSNLSGPGSSGGRGGLSDPFNSGIPIQGLTDNNQAITNTLAGGLNYNDDWSNRTEVNANYFYNRADDRTDLHNTRRYLAPDHSYSQDQHSMGQRHNENQRFTLIADHRIDSVNSIKFTSVLIGQRSSSYSRTIDTSRSFSTAPPSPGTLLNEGFSSTDASASGYTWNGSALFRHRFAKKGRTFSANLSVGLNNSSGSGDLFSVNRYYSGTGNPSVPSTDSLDQFYTLPSSGNNYGLSLVYTEPLSRASLLEFHADAFQRHAHSDKRTMDADSAGKFTLPDAQLTNDFSNRYTYEREGIRWQSIQKRFKLTFGATMQQASSSNRFSDLSGDSILKQSYLNILPDATLQYEFNKYRNLRLFYNTYTNPPALNQLQPVPDNSDPLNVRLGNPGLRQEYYHLLRLNYLSFDPFRRTSFFAMVNYSGIHDRIVNSSQLAASGAQVTMPVNRDGLFRLNGNLTWEFPVRAIRSNLSLSSNLAYDHNGGLVNGAPNNSNNWTVGQGANLNFVSGEALDITAGIRADYNEVRYSLQPAQNQAYWTEDYTLDANWYLRDRFSLASDLDYIHRSGLPAGYNSSPLIWNAGIAEKLFKNKKGTIRLQVFDILSRNTGFSRNTSQNYIEDVSYRVLNRYWLLSFSYNLSRFAGKNMQGGQGSGKMDIKIVR
ncbi:MAG: TonB-dependent receptor [Bacteroidota bacterium]|nr:TonB-dependent receptor [Bacteroidota bacterium]MDP4252602.1 TonB-dependent receptor [Bacteroidota bacterium]